MAKKGEILQAFGIDDSKSAVQMAHGDLVNLVLHDVLLRKRRNLLSGSQLSQDRILVVLPANDSIFCSGIYTYSKNKTSVEYSIPIVAVGSLFHFHTCADADIKRKDRKDYLYIVWHDRLGYLPLQTIRMMLDRYQGLEGLRHHAAQLCQCQDEEGESNQHGSAEVKSAKSRSGGSLRPFRAVQTTHKVAVLTIALGTRGCTQSNGSLKFGICSKKFYADTALLAASTQYAAFIETTLMRIFPPKQRNG